MQTYRTLKINRIILFCCQPGGRLQFKLEIAMRKCSYQPKMNMCVLASLIFDSIRQIKTKLFTGEIPEMRHEIGVPADSFRNYPFRIFRLQDNKLLFAAEIQKN